MGATGNQTGNGATPRSLRVENLEKAYTRGVPVLKGISFQVEGAVRLGIIGPSGSGKSTLLRCINRLIEPTAGNVLVGGQDIAGLSGTALRHARRRIGMVFQEYNLVERLTVIENVLCGRLGYISPFKAWLRKYPQGDIDRAFELIDHVGLGEFYNQRADSLSGGQRQRVGIARAVMQTPDIIMADEPTSSLDPKTSVEIMELLTLFSEDRAIPVLVNIHDVELAKRFCDRLIGISQGEVVFDGPPAQLSTDDLKHIYGGEDWLA